jgi:hypothetical protein
MSVTDPPLTGFASLPAELRLKIWHRTFRPRVVQIYTRDGQFSSPIADICSGRVISNFRWEPYCDNPVALSVCQESRDEALRIYTVQIALPDAPGSIFIDPLCDTVYFLSLRWSKHLTSFLQDWCVPSIGPTCIQSVAVDPNFYLHNQRDIFAAKHIFKEQDLKTLTLVIEEDDSALDEGFHSFSPVGHSFPDGVSYAEVEFGPPETKAELRCWEVYKDRAETAFSHHKKRHPVWEMPNLRVVMARRGPKARGLDPKYCNIEGPVRHDTGWDEM